MKTMKNLSKLLLAACMIISLQVNAQIKVTSSGDVGIGTSSPGDILHISGTGYPRIWIANESYAYTENGFRALVQFRDKNEGSTGYIGYINTNSKNMTIGNNTDGEMIFFNNGAYRMKIHSNGRVKFYENVGINHEPNSNYELWVSGDIYCTGSYLPSDINLKENIETIEKPIDKILSLRGVSYEYVDDILNDSIHNNLPDGKQYGLVAQEVMEIIPEVVKKDENNYLALNYDAIIPFLVEAIKEQQKEIEELKVLVDTSKSDKSAIINSYPSGQSYLSKAKLYQNNPNPFSENTTIKYYLPDETNEASIMIFNMQGTLLKTNNIIDRGNNEIIIYGGDFNPGMYIYSLIANGKEIDTKRMILTD